MSACLWWSAHVFLREKAVADKGQQYQFEDVVADAAGGIQGNFDQAQLARYQHDLAGITGFKLVGDVLDVFADGSRRAEQANGDFSRVKALADIAQDFRFLVGKRSFIDDLG